MINFFIENFKFLLKNDNFRKKFIIIIIKIYIHNIKEYS
jgi:hypothetical protein